MWTGLWFISLIGTQFLIRLDLVPVGVPYWLVAALPLVIAAGALWFWLRYLREADELQRRIQLNAVAFGFGVTFFWITSYSALIAAGAPRLEQNLHMAPGFSAFLLALLYGKWQYR